MAHEALARPEQGTVPELLAHARREGRLAAVDLGLAAAAVRQDARHPTALPLHLNLSPRGDLTEAAPNLFGHLRALDETGAQAIAVMPIPTHGLGEAINDRLRRAAADRPA